jgi:hypothetical protein
MLDERGEKQGEPCRWIRREGKLQMQKAEWQNSPALYMGPRIWMSTEHGIECIRGRVLARIDNQICEGWILRELDLDPAALGAWAARLIGGPRAKPTNPAA